MATYSLKIYALGSFPEVEIDAERYAALRSSHAVLGHALAIEEKYQIVLSNYLDFEREVASVAVSQMVLGASEYADFFDIKLSLNVRLVNLLTAVRLYNDQLVGHVAQCVPGVDRNNLLKGVFAEHYDGNFEYRFMEALRNYVQHSGMPVHRVVLGGRRAGENHELLEYSLSVSSQKSQLESDRKFKRSVLDEMPDEVDLVLAVRAYVESISGVHEAARNAIRSHVSRARGLVEEAISEYQNLHNGTVVGLRARKVEDGSVVEDSPVLLNWDDVRARLEQRSSRLVNLRNRYATTRPRA